MPQPSACLFCQIIQQKVPAATVLEDEILLAFLDHRPLFKGHCLLLPKDHYETLLELPADLLHPLFANAQKLCQAMESALGAEGTFVAVNNKVSQSVPHVHVHVVPRKKGDGLRGFFWPRTKYAEGEIEEYQSRIRSSLQQPPSSPTLGG